MIVLPHFTHVNISGVMYWEGALVFDQLKIGPGLRLVYEADNLYDPNAVAIFTGENKLGFVPQLQNNAMAKLPAMGQNPSVYHTPRFCPAPGSEVVVGIVFEN